MLCYSGFGVNPKFRKRGSVPPPAGRRPAGRSCRGPGCIRGYFPVQTGFRFSMKAVTPSRASSVVQSRAKSSAL